MKAFSNLPVSISDLPRYAEVQLEPVAPDHIKVMLWERLIYWLFITTGLFVLGWQLKLQMALYWRIGLTILALSLLSFMWFTARKAFANMGYAVRQHDIIFRKGWLFEQVHVVPLKKIQHCQVKRGPLERRYRLSSLRIHTAGGDGGDITLGGLPLNTANQLKDWLTGSISALPENQINASGDDTTMV